jgi:hypothetical protein
VGFKRATLLATRIAPILARGPAANRASHEEREFGEAAVERHITEIWPVAVVGKARWLPTLFFELAAT